MSVITETSLLVDVFAVNLANPTIVDFQSFVSLPKQTTLTVDTQIGLFG